MNLLRSDPHISLKSFLPEILEIQESPPHPLARWTGGTILTIFICALAWAWFGSFNIVATGEGKIIPSSSVRELQAFDRSIVRKILVSEGEPVSTGSPLVELDDTLLIAETANVETQMALALSNLEASRELLRMWQATSDDPRTISDSYEMSATSSSFVQYRWRGELSEFISMLEAYRRLIAEVDRSTQILQKYELTLPLVVKHADITRTLFERNFVSEIDYLKSAQEAVSLEKDILAERSSLDSLRHGVAELQEKIRAHRSQKISAYLLEISNLEATISSLKEELNKAKSIQSTRFLYSPVNGFIKEVHIKTIGGVVRDAETIVSIVPQDDHLIAEATIRNKDIGFLREGLPAKIKLHAFPYVRYGHLTGTVTYISRDAIADENLGLVYKIKVALNADHLPNHDQIKVAPGMAATIDISTGERSIFDYVFSSVVNSIDESMDER